MCYNCGCGVKDDDMGKGRVSQGGGSLTEQDVQLLADKWGMDIKEAKKNMFDLLKQELGEK